MGWQDAPVVSADSWQDAPLVAPTANSPVEKKTDWLRQLALGGKAAAQGVAGVLTPIADFVSGTTLKNSLFDGVLPHTQTVSEQLEGGLNRLGAPSPNTSGEMLASAGIRGITGGVMGGGAGLPGALRAGAAGLTSGLSAEGTRQAGGGPWLQFLAGLAGGIAPGALEETARIGVSALTNSARPLLRSGQKQMASNILARQADDPVQAAANLQTAQPVIPNSARTMGEASQDIGLLALEKGLRGKDSSAFGGRLSEQNVARQAELSRVAGTQSDIAAASAARGTITDPMRNSALNNPVGKTIGAPSSQAIDRIDEILASPAGNRDSVATSLAWARGKIADKTNPADLYEVRKDLQLAQRGKLQPSSPNAPNASTLALARKELGDVVDSLDNAIEFAAPGFKAYLQRYKDLSAPIDQMKVMQEIQRRAQLTSTDVTTGQNFLGGANFSRALDAAVIKSGAKLTPKQLQDLNAIRTDLQYGQAINSPLVKAPGSDTFQNLSIAQVIGAGATNAHPIWRVLTKPLDWVYRGAGTDAKVTQLLVDAALDPKLAASMLKRATPQSVQTFSQALKLRALQTGVGTAAGLNATQPPDTAERTMSPWPQLQGSQ